MANVEIYKLKKTVDPAVREYGMFEFFGMVDGPLPQNYVREWAGELPSGNLDTLCGKFFLNPPDGYHGGPLEKSDIAVVDGKPFFLDRESGYKFVELDFDTSNIKDAIHVEYGYYVDTGGAVAIFSNLAEICDELDIPLGYFSNPDYHGSHKGESAFEPSPSQALHDQVYLHPQFLKNAEAREFVDLLQELSQTDRWDQIAGYLRENYPVYMSDLESARERFAPELLLPAELRSLSKVIPTDADKSELAYLAAKVRNMDGDHRNVFDSVVEAGRHCGSVAEIINLTENLDCFDLMPSFSESGYGAYRLERDWEACEEVFERLEHSSNPAERELAKLITRLERCADEVAYGYQIAEEEGGVFTSHGYLTGGEDFKEIYRGTQDIPAEYRASAPPSAAEMDRPLIMVGCNVDLSGLLLEMHALGGDFMRYAKHNLQTLATGGNEFFIMMNENSLTVTPAEPVFHRGTSEYETWMAMEKTSDSRTFVLSVTERRDGIVYGSLCETDLAALRSSVQMNSIKPDDPAAEDRLTAFLDVFRWAIEQNRRAVPTGVFLEQINESFKAQAHAPKPAGFRVSPETARVLLAQDAVNIYKAYPEPVAQLMPIDAAKTSLWTGNKFEYFVRHLDSERLERWAKLAAGEMLQQSERSEHNKSHETEH